MEYVSGVGRQHAGHEHPVLRRSASSVAIIPQRQPQSQAGAVISKIEDIFESMADNLINEDGNLSIPYRSRTATARSRAAAEGVVTFPGRTPQEAKKFGRASWPLSLISFLTLSFASPASVLRILEISRTAIATGAIITKRNIYYQNTDLFREQRVVDRLVDDIAFTLGVGRDDLNIVAAAKGLIAGPVTLTMRNHSVIPCGLTHESGTLIPTPKLIQKIDFGHTEWILVIEKEATFRTLAASGYHTKSLAGHGILITGKGFPDLATRSFLSILHSVRPHMPMYALVDYDPDGVSILRNYKVGSSGLLHEQDTTAPELRWLGIRSDQILPTAQSAEDSSQSSQETSSSQDSMAFSAAGRSDDEQLPRRPQSRRSRTGQLEDLSQLTRRDRGMAVRILKSVCNDQDDVDEMEQMRELQVMLMLNVKAEIQAVDNLGDITGWLDEKLCA